MRGLTLVELLVALTVGLGVVLASARLLLLANDAYAVQADRAAIDDAGRFAIELLGRSLRQAAPFDPGALVAEASGDGPVRITGLDARTLPRATSALDGALADAVNGSDVLAVRYGGAGAAPHGDGSGGDCAGFTVHEAKEGWSIFYVARNGDGLAELRCKYKGAANWSADAVVAGVDGFQVLYGFDSDTPPDGIPNRYVNASALAALDAGLAPGERNEKTAWKRVASVQVALLLHGEKASGAPVQPQSYALFGTAYGAAQGSADAGVQLMRAELDGAAPAPARRLFTAVFVVGAGHP